MNIHEYQAKALLRRYGVRVPNGQVAFSVTAAAEVPKKLFGSEFVVKAQVHAGGRGKAGGVRFVESSEQAATAAEDLLGSTLVTSQTGVAGQRVHRVYVEERCDVVRELYLALLVDRSKGRVCIVASKEGGEEVEAVLEQDPDKLRRVPIDPDDGLQADTIRRLAADLYLSDAAADAAVPLLTGVYDAFIDNDASLIELNPLGVTRSGELVALDVKMVIDDNALMRHADLEALRDEAEMDAAEIEARRYALNYLKLTGNIGCMVNGAGLALATHDLIVEKSGAPADFMDIRPEATRGQVATGFRMLLANRNVKCVFVNLCGGGILRCDTVAEGIADVVRDGGLPVPLIFRAAGTNADLSRKVLTDQGVDAVFATNLGRAADLAVQQAAEGVA